MLYYNHYAHFQKTLFPFSMDFIFFFPLSHFLYLRYKHRLHKTGGGALLHQSVVRTDIAENKGSDSICLEDIIVGNGNISFGVVYRVLGINWGRKKYIYLTPFIQISIRPLINIHAKYSYINGALVYKCAITLINRLAEKKMSKLKKYSKWEMFVSCFVQLEMIFSL